ncbi:MAG: heme exporter protein CcmD [Gammaproteobacteria bacterium]|nr:MAG: heme exporter protein CcmD [Gammaproteobacteria bacterium]RLA61943.1 MAG: heme exporter protein CcmD [Gammaproteobacteria bacterium]
MYFDSFDALLTMGGHGGFVWSAYLITILVMAAILIAPGRRRKKFLRQLAGELKRSRGDPNITEEEV